MHNCDDQSCPQINSFGRKCNNYRRVATSHWKQWPLRNTWCFQKGISCSNMLLTISCTVISRYTKRSSKKWMNSIDLKISSLLSTFTEEEPYQETKSKTPLLANSRLETFSLFNEQLLMETIQSSKGTVRHRWPSVFVCIPQTPSRRDSKLKLFGIFVGNI